MQDVDQGWLGGNSELGVEVLGELCENVVDYPDGQEVPPKQESDETAASYLGTLKLYCLIQSRDVSWATPTLKVQVKGLEKTSMARMAGKLVTELALLTGEVLFKVADVATCSA